MNLKGYARKSAQVILGVGLAQIIAVALIPIVTRVYSPHEFSVYSSYVYVTSLVSTLLIFRFDNILIPVKFSAKKSLAFNYFISFYFFVFFLTLIFLFVFILLFDVSGEDLNIFVYVLGSVATAIFQFVMGALVSGSDYKKISALRMAQAGTLGIFQIGFAFIAVLHSLGLMFGDALSRLVSLLLYGRQLICFSPSRLLRTFLVFRGVVMPLFAQSAFSTLSTLLSTASLLSPIFFLGLLFEDKASVALFLLSYKLLAVPVSLISRSMAQVFLGEGQKLIGAEIRAAVKSVLAINGGIALLVCSAVMLVAPWVEPVLGEEWVGVADYVRVLLPLTFGQMLLHPIVQVYILKNKNQELFFWEIFRCVCVHLAVIAAYLFGLKDPLGLVLVYSCAMGVAYLMLLIRIFRVG